MKRFDLRNLKDDFYKRLGELIDEELQNEEVGIFIFELGNFENVQKSADFIKNRGDELMNSIRFNQVDWTLVVKKGS
ncbi:NADH-ubiquinone oxidoreductase subunit E family protein [Helicobacter sp. 11S03491-1]|uniref:NADH-ubiquinone oxidoreductase subunit E family protein n=1 Tax=Helicobacter sp. 11S03491-1 TaxID=1476196 RepID=UPI000BA6DFA7|nr:NADH-ubiquinone oxidoreductase subunit E family protein [Helicobacter sp. 11S03491-1]PAF42199.1 hypothetical protein BKH45_04435 [Helicobacter sp. 11S03491-1]